MARELTTEQIDLIHIGLLMLREKRRERKSGESALEWQNRYRDQTVIDDLCTDLRHACKVAFL